MRRLFSLFTALLALAFFSAVAAAAEGEPPALRVAVDAPYPPFAMYSDEGELTGFDVEIARALCKEIGRNCRIVPAALGGILPGIAAGEYDIGVAGFVATEERERLADFTERYFSSLSIFIQWGSKPYDLRPESVKGFRIAVRAGSEQGAYVKRVYGDTVTVIARDTFEDTLALLQSGGAELALVGGLSGFTFLKSPEGEEYELVGDPVSLGRNNDFATIAVSRDMPELRRQLNEAIQIIRHNGEYGRINRKYFEFSVY